MGGWHFLRTQPSAGGLGGRLLDADFGALALAQGGAPLDALAGDSCRVCDRAARGSGRAARYSFQGRTWDFSCCVSTTVLRPDQRDCAFFFALVAGGGPAAGGWPTAPASFVLGGNGIGVLPI